MSSPRLSRSSLVTLVGSLLAVVLSTWFFSHIQVHSPPNPDRLVPTATARRTSADLRVDGEARMEEETLQLSRFEREKDQAAAARAPYQVEVGVYATNNYAVDLSVPRYSGKGYLWLKWNRPLQDYLDRQQLSIQRVITPVNLLGNSEAEQPIEPLGPGPEMLPDGRLWQAFAYHGEFYIDQLRFKRFPINTLTLPIAIEADDPDGSLAYQGLRLTPDLTESGLGKDVDVNGYVNLGFTAAEYKHHYNTSFGLGDSASSDYSQLIYRVVYGRSIWSAFWTLLQPLAIVMAMIIVSTRIQHDIWDVRVGIPVTVLLTLVFMQESYRGTLPALPYLTFLDKIYVVAYLITLIAFIFSVRNGRYLQQARQSHDAARIAAVEAQMDRFDRLWPPSVLSVMLVLMGICWLV